MTERLSDIRARIETVHKLASVISAMRGIAASRAQEAHRHVESIRLFARTIGEAIGQAMAFMPDVDPSAEGTAPVGNRALILFATEQGFTGGFNQRVFDTAAECLREPHDLFVVGEHGLILAEELGFAVSWSAPMIAHPAQAGALATRLTDAIYERMAAAGLKGVSVIHAVPGGTAEPAISEKQLVPFDFSRFPAPAHASLPLVTLAPETLLERLVEEYVFAELSEAVMLSFAAENEARMRAMIAAHDNVSDTLDGLISSSKRLRQQEITEEIVELAAGVQPTR